MKLYPMRLKPCYKEYLWGGNRLKTNYGKNDSPPITAESWELACHADGMCTIAEGQFQGRMLTELEREPFWGRDCPPACFPILVKLIDAKKDLSIQVHPSDDTALRERGEQGKAEMWYVMEATPNAFIYYGFCKETSPDELRQRAENGSICDVLNRVPVQKGDVFYILPGTIHAIGAGLVIAEIQQNSNTTFRIYDYQRRDVSGQLRPLHLDRATAVVNGSAMLPEECKVNHEAVFPTFAMVEMFSCHYFRAYRFCIDSRITLHCDGSSFHHLLFADGSGYIRCQGKAYTFAKGDSFFMPADLGDYTIEGSCTMLLSRI